MKPLNEFTETELKAAAFEQIQARDIATSNLNAIMQELQRRKDSTPKPENIKPE